MTDNGFTAAVGYAVRSSSVKGLMTKVLIHSV